MIATLSFLVLLLVMLPLAPSASGPCFGPPARRASIWFAILHLTVAVTVAMFALGVLKYRGEWTPVRPIFVPGHHENAGHRTTWTLLSLSATPPSPFYP